MYQNMTIGQRILVGFGIVLSLALLTVGISYQAIQGVAHDAQACTAALEYQNELLRVEARMLDQANRLVRDVTGPQADRVDLPTSPASTPVGQWLSGEVAGTLARRFEGAEARLADLRAVNEQYCAGTRMLRDALSDGKGPRGDVAAVQRVLATTTWPSVEKMRQGLIDLQNLVADRAPTTKRLIASARASSLTILTVGIMAATLAVMIGLMLGRVVTRHVSATVAAFCLDDADVIHQNQVVRQKIEELSTLVNTTRHAGERARDHKP